MSLFGAIREIFRAMWHGLTLLRRAVFNLIFLFILLVVAVALLQEEGIQVPEGSALILSPAGVVVDQVSYIDPLSTVLADDAAPRETLLAEMIDAIDGAAKDNRIRMLVIQTDAMQHAGLSKLQELAAAIERFRAAGKPVVAIGDSFSQDQYWLAAQADRILMNPLGEVLIQGYGVYGTYFRQALDKLDINVHVFRVGAYKSAVEPFLRDDMSDDVRRNHLVWLNSLWQQYRDSTGARRHIAPEKFDEYANNLDKVLAATQGDAGRAALEWKLVDALMSREEINQELIAQVGEDDEGWFNAIDFRDYLTAHKHLPAVGKPKIGVIVGSGMILDGEQRNGLIGGDTLAGLLRQARLDDDVKAVVLRVDSEGGSAFAAEIIRREVLALKAAGKPLVVSMGSIAASGGYWIAADADEVWATPATITGSIGIFGVFPTVEDSLARLGVHTDGVGTTAIADAFRIDRPVSPAVATALQSTLDAGYQRFLHIVASGRDMPVEAVDKVAQGQIWSGADAQRLGLVDKLGGLDDAIRAAAGLADLKDYTEQLIKPPLTPQELLFAKFVGVEQGLARAVADVFGSSGAPALAASLDAYRPLFAQWQKFSRWNDPRHTYVLCEPCARL
jgi:protease-4